MLNDINNFIKWLALGALIKNEVSNVTKIAFFFLYEIYFLLANFHFKFNSTKQEKTFHYKRFSLKVTNKSFTQD